MVDPFWGGTTPQSISAFPRALQVSGEGELQKSLDISIRYLVGEQFDDEDFEERNETLVAACQAIIVATLKVNAGQDVVIRDLTNIGVSPEMAKAIWKVRTKSKCTCTLKALT